MSERTYALLLRLYPSHFRDAFGDAALQLFRDRARNERGFVARIRLWRDLLADLAVSVPLEYRRARPVALVAASRTADTGPAFRFLEGESPRPFALVLGGILSLGVVFAFSIPGRAGSAVPSPAWPASGSPAMVQLAPPDHPLPVSAGATGHTALDASERQRLDDSDRQRVLEAAMADLRQYYIDPDVAKKTADALLAHEKNGDYNSVTDAAAFADLLTTQIRAVSEDNHLGVIYSKTPLADRPPGPQPGAQEQYRKIMERENCTFEKVAILARNIGCLKLNSFPDPAVCQSTASAAMAELNRADAVIFDLRDNRGGQPAMVALIAAYLFDHPEYWYNPRENTTERSWTRSPVPGSLLADKPVYVLTSSRTFSGAEHFSYDLKMLKRAMIVGETTGGAAHAGEFHRIDDHFAMGITEVRAINPYSKHDWEGTGVEPDVKVKETDALATAERLAESRLRKK